jgi:hypothetical protein
MIRYFRSDIIALRNSLELVELSSRKLKLILVRLYFSDFLDQDSTHAINVDAKTYNHVKLNLNNPSFNTFDEAQVCAI